LLGESSPFKIKRCILTKVKYGKESNDNKILKIRLVFNFEFLSMHSGNEYGWDTQLIGLYLPAQAAGESCVIGHCINNGAE
jgi:hypothetical protein